MKLATPSYTPPRGGMATALSVVDCQANTVSLQSEPVVVSECPGWAALTKIGGKDLSSVAVRVRLRPPGPRILSLNGNRCGKHPCTQLRVRRISESERRPGDFLSGHRDWVCH